jgi:hypothetical protein
VEEIWRDIWMNGEVMMVDENRTIKETIQCKPQQVIPTASCCHHWILLTSSFQWYLIRPNQPSGSWDTVISWNPHLSSQPFPDHSLTSTLVDTSPGNPTPSLQTSNFHSAMPWVCAHPCTCSPPIPLLQTAPADSLWLFWMSRFYGNFWSPFNTHPLPI